MVLIRKGDETKTRNIGRLDVYEDSVWNLRHDATRRISQLDSAGYYAYVTDKEVKVGVQTVNKKPEPVMEIHYTVWRSASKRKGSRK